MRQRLLRGDRVILRAATSTTPRLRTPQDPPGSDPPDRPRNTPRRHPPPPGERLGHERSPRGRPQPIRSFLMMSSGSILAPCCRELPKRLTDSPPLMSFRGRSHDEHGSDSTNQEGPGRATTVFGTVVRLEDSDNSGSRKPRSEAVFAEGVGLEPTSPFGQRFSSYEH